ncbi:DUF1294 domain-containing protein [Kordiimonas sp. SCSIO 12610]|uniref:DUF1294 domain-containing protein n=1 Tax=Kordiimonas sp. SCSIO 12610 TaxID=2829597 RepID=UPI0021091004|nr:DUF1294 domain-containing protein [Kordiimonas sp. SCSIO 12610]UTW56159.1 DUF1294 domain-containing protein [Kordiimonas sp. SCSIO 12610]
MPEITPVLILEYYGAMNLIAFCIYGFDKFLAVRGLQRISERSLLILPLLGGIFGAFFAMKLFRHKTAKRSFNRGFTIVSILHIVVILLVYYRHDIGIFVPVF